MASNWKPRAGGVRKRTNYGRESAGAPDFVHDAAAARVVIPLHAGNRSLNVAMAGAIALHEALRQTGLLPETDPQVR